ncbi:MAG: serine/threonine protein phosphatase [Sphingomonadales bacterium]|nr:serine/threonine protein phosphatase [Sphingomonadales bacterium]
MDVSRPSGKVDGQLVYAIGDIHGCYDALRQLLAMIARDAGAHAAGRTASLIFCGDYVDRGPDSSQVLDALCWLKRHGPFHAHFLKGNHEEVMLAYIADPAAAKVWMRFGGSETLRSYDVTPPSADDDAERHIAARDDLLERMPVAHLRFLESLELMVGLGDYAFVHAGVRPGVPLADQSQEDLLWIREGFIDVAKPFERIIVHGHSWTSDQPTLLPHRIGIDTGVYETGVLTALRLEDGRIETLSTR